MNTSEIVSSKQTTIEDIVNLPFYHNWPYLI